MLEHLESICVFFRRNCLQKNIFIENKSSFGFFGGAGIFAYKQTNISEKNGHWIRFSEKANLSLRTKQNKLKKKNGMKKKVFSVVLFET